MSGLAVDHGRTLVHTREEFAFAVEAPIDSALALFGAHRERDWAPDWSPEILWPSPPGDRQGMVFTVAHDDKTAVWINTLLDATAHRVQYVYVLPEVVATVITIALTPDGRRTRATVCYERTALTQQTNAVVEHMAAQDRAAGPIWARQIQQHLSAHPQAQAKSQ